MTLVEILLRILSEIVYISIFKSLSLSNGKHFTTIGSCKKLTMTVEEFQSIPMARVMRCCDYYSTVCSCHGYGKFCSRSRGKTDVHDIKAHTHESATDNAANHLTRDACITPYHNLV